MFESIFPFTVNLDYLAEQVLSSLRCGLGIYAALMAGSLASVIIVQTVILIRKYRWRRLYVADNYAKKKPRGAHLFNLKELLS